MILFRLFKLAFAMLLFSSAAYAETRITYK
jgi:hypothetical protein